MKKLLIGFLVVAVMLLAIGCVQPASPPVYTPSPEPPIPYIPPDIPPAPIPQVDNGGLTPVLPDEPPEDMTWISPGKVMVSNFYPGARAEYPLLVHNGNDTTASFAIYYRYPDHVDEECVKPPEEVQDWVIVADPTPVLMPKETREILVVLDMPNDAEVFAPKWEFWVGVMDTTQTGMVKTELCCRWLITMR